MNEWWRDLPLEERLKLVEDIWDSIVAEQQALPLTDTQRAELDRRLEAYAQDGDKGVDAFEAIETIRRSL